MNKYIYSALATATLLSTAHAAVLVQDDFESYVAGVDDALDFTGIGWGGGQRALWDVVNTGAPASTLTGNYIAASSRLGNWTFVDQDAATAATTIATMSLDLVIPSAVGTNGKFRISLQGNNGARVVMSHVEIGGSSNTVGDLSVALTEDTTHRIDAVMNTTASSISFGTETLAADSIAIYVDGALSFTTVADNNANYVQRVGLWANPEEAGVTDTFYLDNLIYQDIAIVTGAVPEPGSAMLVGLGALGFALRRRK